MDTVNFPADIVNIGVLEWALKSANVNTRSRKRSFKTANVNTRSTKRSLKSANVNTNFRPNFNFKLKLTAQSLFTIFFRYCSLDKQIIKTKGNMNMHESALFFFSHFWKVQFVPHDLKNFVAVCHQFFINIFTGVLSVDNLVQYEHNKIFTILLYWGRAVRFENRIEQ